jgi:hypothetical protein
LLAIYDSAARSDGGFQLVSSIESATMVE